MPTALSYPSLQCVLEFLDANKRQYIVARTPTIQQINNLLPINLSNLEFTPYRLALDSLYITVSDTKLTWKKNNARLAWEQRFPEGVEKDEMWTEITKFYLSERQKFHVNRLHIFSTESRIVLPSDVSLRVNEMRVDGCFSFKNYLSIVDPSSFPLKRLCTLIDGESTFDNPVFNSAETLTCTFSPRTQFIPLTKFDKVLSKNVRIDYTFFWHEKVVELIKHWREVGKEIGTNYVFFKDNKGNITDALTKLNDIFSEFNNKLEGVDERFIIDSPRFLIPMNSTAEIMMYGNVATERGLDHYELTVKITSIDTDMQSPAIKKPRLAAA
ncbi:hypothetical protein GCK72_022908 [Caenorhabditis remanei]|uniref:F-box associated domain-containing protein n=1 Tax=Caenorhabditis remanei TaxID=31234 RepID=A0A6A5FV64_CAERE|nr:hypothetical protein GCK72_022908 [Caenorhabditis remanei]KAF1746452.1 hypothetical protein GCK72_022908 [Caenorhabditis remanei]